MEKYTDEFIKTIYKYLPKNQSDWELVGFINKQQEIYTFGNDSKIIGRLFEIIVYPALKNTANELGYELYESKKQTVYPDYYFLKPNGKKIALDVKTTYRKTKKSKYGFTGGSFTSFMRDGTKNIEGNYSDYDSHYILGVVYDRVNNMTAGLVNFDDLDKIIPAYKNIEFFVQEKYRICGDKKGSGNTDNIGTIKSNRIEPFVYGAGPFSFLGSDVFQDYWMNYPRNTDSREKKDSLYTNLTGYIKWLEKKDSEKAKEINKKYLTYLKEYAKMEDNSWKKVEG